MSGCFIERVSDVDPSLAPASFGLQAEERANARAAKWLRGVIIRIGAAFSSPFACQIAQLS